MKKKELILASKSPRRIEILHDMGLKFEVYHPEVAELSAGECNNDLLPTLNARRKSEAVAHSLPSPEHLVLGADTIVLLNNKIIGKPVDRQDAINILLSLSGHSHHVITGVCLTCLADNLSIVFSDRSEVQFKNFGQQTAENYIDTVYVLDKAGAYAVQDGGKIIIERITGSFSNVMGLPKEKLSKTLRENSLQ